MINFTNKQKDTLDKAREVYGIKSQLAVTAEECNELSIAVLKFMRYADVESGLEHTREDVLEERVDVEIMLSHIDEIYKITSEEVEKMARDKINRLKRWLSHSADMEYTTIDRDVR